jgi:Fe-S-cluster containining protein
VARAGLARVDEVLKLFLPVVESRGEHKIACAAGCSACCNNFVRCSLPEALLVADWLKLPENAHVLARFGEKLPAWRERAGATTRELEQILERSGGTEPEGADWERFKSIGHEYALRQNLCPFNHEGRCEVYPVRPTICRAVHVLETNYYCTPGRGGSPKVVSHPKLEEAVQEATTSYGRAAASLTGSGRERALPESVAWALENG